MNSIFVVSLLLATRRKLRFVLDMSSSAFGFVGSFSSFLESIDDPEPVLLN